MLTASSLQERQTAIPDKYIRCGLKDRKFYSWLLKVIMNKWERHHLFVHLLHTCLVCTYGGPALF